MSALRKMLTAAGELARKGFFHVLLGGVAVKFVAFASSIVIVRLLTKDDYAIVVYVDNIYNYIYLVAGLGFASGVLKFCVSDDQAVNRSYFSFALKWGLVFQAAFSIGCILLFRLMELPLAGASSMGLLLAVYPCFNYASSLLMSMARAGLHNKLYAWLGLLQAVLLLFLSIVFVEMQGYLGVVTARYAAIMAIIVVSVVALKRDVVGDCAILSADQKRKFVSFSIHLLLAGIFSMAIPLNETFLVNNILKDPSDISNYKIAALIPSQLTFFTSAIMIYYTPYFARMGSDEEAWKEAKKCALLSGAIVLGAVIVGMFLNAPIISLVYGDAYNNAINLAFIMWIAYGLNAGFRMVPMNILPLLGHERFNLALSVVTCFVHFIIDAAMIVAYGVSGAVAASVIVYIGSGAAYWMYLRKKTKGIS